MTQKTATESTESTNSCPMSMQLSHNFKQWYRTWFKNPLNKHCVFAYLLTPGSRVLLEKLTGFQLVKKFPAFYITLTFITAFTSACHLSLPWASLIQSIPPTSHFLKIHLNIILPSMPGFQQWSLSLRFPRLNPVYISPLPHTRYIHRTSHSTTC